MQTKTTSDYNNYLIIAIFVILFAVSPFSQVFMINSGHNIAQNNVSSKDELLFDEKFIDPNLDDVLQDTIFSQIPFEDVIVTSDSSIPVISKELKSLVANFNGIILDELEELSSYRIILPKESLKLFHETLKDSYQLNYHLPYSLHSFPNDPYYPLQWHLKNSGLPAAWNKTLGDNSNASVLIGIIDTGVDYNHEDLINNYLPLGKDWFRNDSDPYYELNHGVHVAGIIAGEINNNKGIAGVGNIKFFMEKVFGDSSITGDWYLAQGIISAVNNGANITSSSWGGVYSTVVHDAFKYASSKGVINIAAAGNDNSNIPGYPAALPETISASALTQLDTKADFSNWGSTIDLSAGGVNIYSTLPNNAYGVKSGTSMSTPIVSGIIGLMMSYYGDFINNESISTLLPSIVDDLGSPGKDDYFGWGKINATIALMLSIPPVIDNISFTESLIIDNDQFMNFSVKDLYQNPLNISIDLLGNNSYVDTIESFNNTHQEHFSVLLNVSTLLDGLNYSLQIFATNGVFSSSKFTQTFSIDKDKHLITNITIINPLANSINSEELNISWIIDDLDGPPHFTTVSLLWDTNEQIIGTTTNYSLIVPISSYPNRSDYQIKLNSTDLFSSYNRVSSPFTITNPPFIPEMMLFYPALTNTTILSGVVDISWEQHDRNGDLLNTTLTIVDTTTLQEYFIATNLSQSLEVYSWDTLLVPDGNYSFRFLISDGYFTTDYSTIDFSIDNPHIPQIDILTPTNDNLFSKGLLNITWNIVDEDADNISGTLEYRLVTNPFDWKILTSNISTNFFLWDTGKLSVPNGSITQLRLNITDNMHQVIYESDFITLITPLRPVMTILSPIILPEETVTEISGIIEFSWESEDPNNDLLTHTLWFQDVNSTQWIKILTLEENTVTQDSPVLVNWNSSAIVDHQVLFRLNTTDGYFSVTTDIGLFNIIRVFRPIVTLTTKGDSFFGEIPFSISIIDNDTENFVVDEYYQLDGSDEWIQYNTSAITHTNPYSLENFFVNHTFVNSIITNNIRLKIVIYDFAFLTEIYSPVIHFNLNTAPTIISQISDQLTVYHDSHDISIKINDVDNQDIEVELVLKKLYTNESLYSEKIINKSNSWIVFDVDWYDFENEEYLLVFILTDIFSPTLTHLNKSNTLRGPDLLLAIPRISIYPDPNSHIEFSNVNTVKISFLIENPVNLDLTSSLQLTSLDLDSDLLYSDIDFTLNISRIDIWSEIYQFQLDFGSLKSGEYLLSVILRSDYGEYYYSLSFSLHRSTVNFISFMNILIIFIVIILVRSKIFIEK